MLVGICDFVTSTTWRKGVAVLRVMVENFHYLAIDKKGGYACFFLVPWIICWKTVIAEAPAAR